MSDFPTIDGQGGQFVNSQATVTGASNTYGAWTQLSAALPFDVGRIRAWPFMSITDNWVFQYGVGGAGAEVGVVEFAALQVSAISPTIDIPIFVPSGARFSVRAKCVTASQTAYPDQAIYPVGSMLAQMPLQRATTYGISGSGGTSVSTGSTQNFGSWTQLSASTTNPMRQAVVCFQAVTTSEALIIVNVGIGGAGSEISVVGNFYFYLLNAAKVTLPFSQNFDVNIPAGVRLSMRMQAPNIAGTYTVLASIIGLD